MKQTNLFKILMAVPVGFALAQTPKPAPPVNKPASKDAGATAMPAGPSTPAPAKSNLTLEDIPGSDPVVLSVGDEKLTKTQFEQLLAALPDQVRSRAKQDAGKRQIAEQLGQLLSMAQEARKRGLDKNPDTRQLIAFQTDNVLANSLYREVAAGIKPDEAAAREYFDKHKTEYEQVSARHILIRFKGSQVPLRPNEKDLTEEEALAKAQEVRKKLLAGEDFAKLAEAESDDVSSGKMGGSLGRLQKDEWCRPLKRPLLNSLWAK